MNRLCEQREWGALMNLCQTGEVGCATVKARILHRRAWPKIRKNCGVSAPVETVIFSNFQADNLTGAEGGVLSLKKNKKRNGCAVTREGRCGETPLERVVENTLRVVGVRERPFPTEKERV